MKYAQDARVRTRPAVNLADAGESEESQTQLAVIFNNF